MLIPCLEDGPRSGIKHLYKTALVSSNHHPAITPNFAGMSNVGESGKRPCHLAGPAREYLQAHATCDDERLCGCAVELVGLRWRGGDMCDGVGGRRRNEKL